MTASETNADKSRALIYAVLVHALGIAMMSFGLWWTHTTVVVTPPGPVIEATLVGPAQAPRPKASKPKPPKPTPPKPEPKAEPKQETPPEPPKPDTKEQERITALAAEKAAEEKHEQDERRRREQVLLEEEKKKDAAEKKKKLEEEKKKQLAEKQAREQAEKQKKADQQHLQELMEAEEAKTGGEGKDDSVLAQYVMAIQNAVVNNWLRPDNAQPGLRCTVRIIQIPGGEVISAKVASPCNADALTRQSIEQAVMRASPLPYKGFESVFERDINFNFSYNE
jgi:colicin import membrane protein